MSNVPHARRRPSTVGSLRRAATRLAAGLLAGLGPGLLACGPTPADSNPPAADSPAADSPAAESPAAIEPLRVAVFNVQELSLEKLEVVDTEGRGVHPQLRAAAAVIQHVRPDVLLLNEIDVSAEHDVAGLFAARYLSVAQAGLASIELPYRFAAPVNTGLPSGLDLNGDGDTLDPEDAWGFGRYPGQYGMAVLSRLPIASERVRTFQTLRWASLPNALLPDGRDGRPAYYPPKVADQLRLSSKSHWIVPIELGSESGTLQLLASHPTPPGFDGVEDHNGRRNFDEIRLLAEILDNDPADHTWLRDDRGIPGGLAHDQAFVLLGDLNADPFTGAAADPARPTLRAIDQLLEHPRVEPLVPRAESEPPKRPLRAGESPRPPYPGPARSRTAAYGRIDYALPSRGLEVLSSGIFLPPNGDPRRGLVEGPDRASDHFLVWIDLARPLLAPAN